ncbi:hypothetical protein [Methylococcus sp. EFPC2]|uniref:hypothetical protein n=1 Tax=Methylococcus sp. EFPC2 TaxID=2812648 RepID=UPI00196889C7|nr:hypothetical protein [Methylococcus sp. EFPC2]QSA98624.1 hypothetical protein JWZ97_07475 [Methylococcus sp. EFPC2]
MPLYTIHDFSTPVQAFGLADRARRRMADQQMLNANQQTQTAEQAKPNEWDRFAQALGGIAAPGHLARSIQSGDPLGAMMSVKAINDWTKSLQPGGTMAPEALNRGIAKTDWNPFPKFQW